MYRLHILDQSISSWSLRPWLLMKMLGLPFAESVHRLADKAQWQHLAPAGKMPVLDDGAVRVWDSLAIIEYLAERHSGVWPAAAEARAWARSAAAEMHSGFPALRQQCPFRLDDAPAPPLGEDLRQELARIDTLWKQGLNRFGGPFLAGAAFSAADAFFAPVAVRLRHYDLLCHLHAAAADYAQVLLTLPPLQQWYGRAESLV
ncbi:MAG: glutathione S-transferase N-terminal domain-containing protein [Eikenella sp.]|nr:glutathione S-transferase N-terminal domain-containing protein [Eikenella sp.]